MIDSIKILLFGVLWAGFWGGLVYIVLLGELWLFDSILPRMNNGILKLICFIIFSSVLGSIISFLYCAFVWLKTKLSKKSS